MAAIIAQVIGTVAVNYGLGNQWLVILELGMTKQFLLFTWLAIWLFQVAIPIGKVAVASFLLALHPLACKSGHRFYQMEAHSLLIFLDRTRRRLLYFVAISNPVLTLPQLLMIFFQCDPPNALWNFVQQGQCNFDVSTLYAYFLGGKSAHVCSNHTFDMWIHLPRRIRLGRSFRFCHGNTPRCASVAT